MTVIINTYFGHEITTTIDEHGESFSMGGVPFETLALAIAEAKKNPIVKELTNGINA